MTGFPWRRLFWIVAFGIAFAYVESAVVVYLRALSYPDGFRFPLRFVAPFQIRVEFAREAATIVMLLAVAVVAGQRRWDRFGWFLVSFAVWDIFYYVWLKVLLDWPRRVTEWDLLFLIPVPWVAPVLAPLMVSSLMLLFGTYLIDRVGRSLPFHPGPRGWALAILSGGLVLLSFMLEAGVTLQGGVPASYHYEMLAVGLILGIAAFLLACRSPSGKGGAQ